MHGVFQSGTGSRLAEITDGLSNTFMAGEKHVPMDKLGVGAWDCSTYNGGSYKCSTRTAGLLNHLTTDPKNQGWHFGSRHVGVVQFVFADGRVQAVKETTPPWILDSLTKRNDGRVIPDF